MRPVRDENSSRRVDAAIGEAVELREKSLGIEHDAVADDACHPWMQNARRNLPQNELTVADDDGMARVRPALVANDEIGPLGHDVDELTFTFVSPLRSDDHHTGSLGVEHVSSSRVHGTYKTRLKDRTNTDRYIPQHIPQQKSPSRGPLGPRKKLRAVGRKVNSWRRSGRLR